MLKRMGKDDLADDKDPGIFSWLTGAHLNSECWYTQVHFRLELNPKNSCMGAEKVDA